MKVRELSLYTDKIEEADIKNFFEQIVRAKIPFLGFIDFSGIMSVDFVNVVVKRQANTIQFFVREKEHLKNVSSLIFPYRLAEPMELEDRKTTISPKFYILSGEQDFLNFMMKENVELISLHIMQMFGRYIGIGNAINDKGRKFTVISTTPAKFLKVDLEKNPSTYIEVLEPIPKRIALTSKYPLFEEVGISVGVDNFDPFQHTIAVGASGTGKTKAMYALIRAIEEKHKDDVRFVILDPHSEFLKVFPNRKTVDFVHNYIEPLDVGGQKTPLMSQLITQLISSSIGQENKYSERVLYYAVNLLSAVDKLDLKNISALLTNSSTRAEFVSMTDNDEVKRFFDEEFNDIYIHNFNTAILPILNFVGEYELNLGGDKKKESLYDLIGKNRVTVISFNPQFFGQRMIKFLAGAVINQMYILALTNTFKKPTILVIDEVSRVETKVLKDILSETRKFNMYSFLSAQYLGQLSKEVLDSIISNVRNIIAFKLNKQDATLISSIIEIKIEEYFKKHRSLGELEESKKEMFVKLHQRECIVRLFDGTKYILPMKLKVVDVARWKEPGVEFVEEVMDEQIGIPLSEDEEEAKKRAAEREAAIKALVAKELEQGGMPIEKAVIMVEAKEQKPVPPASTPEKQHNVGSVAMKETAPAVPEKEKPKPFDSGLMADDTHPLTTPKKRKSRDRRDRDEDE